MGQNVSSVWLSSPVCEYMAGAAILFVWRTGYETDEDRKSNPAASCRRTQAGTCDIQNIPNGLHKGRTKNDGNSKRQPQRPCRFLFRPRNRHRSRDWQVQTVPASEVFAIIKWNKERGDSARNGTNRIKIR